MRQVNWGNVNKILLTDGDWYEVRNATIQVMAFGTEAVTCFFATRAVDTGSLMVPLESIRAFMIAADPANPSGESLPPLPPDHPWARA
jgi:hypothetical protein